MNVFLVRAGLTAGDPSAPEQHLSPEGRQVVRQVATSLARLESPSFDRVVCAPSFACAQTAELFAERVDYLGVVEALAGLAAGVPPEVAAREILARGDAVAVVADEPYLSALGAFLVGRPTFPPLLHGQVSVLEDRRPAYCLRPGDQVRSLLLLA